MLFRSYRLAFRKTERMLCIEEGQCPAIAPRTGRSRVPKRLCRPAVPSTTHSQLTDEELAEQQIYQNTIRLSIGTEHIDDIIADLEAGFAAVRGE